MEEVNSQIGETIIGVMGGLIVLGALALLLSDSPAGVLRNFIIYMLESAC